MSNIYLDPVSGNDSTGDGSIGNPYKTITAGATAARIAPGDEVRIKKSADPASLGVNVTFTNNSATATLASALTANVSTCESAWTQSANVTQSNSATRKEGSYSQQFVFGSSFTTGKVAYFDFGAGTKLNLSAYQKLALWFYVNNDFAASVFRIDLCSDATGDTPIDAGHQLTIAQAMGYDGLGSSWHRIVLDKGSAFSSSVRSISIHALSDPGTATIRLDNIVACNTFHQHCLIGDGTNDWYPITSVNGTTVTLSVAFQDYTGSLAGTKAAYAVYDFYPVDALPTAYSTVGIAIQDSGTSASALIKFRGGWNFSSDLQDGFTNFTAYCGHGYLLNVGGKDYVQIENLRTVGGYKGITDSGSASIYTVLKNVEVYESADNLLFLDNIGTTVIVEGTVRLVAGGDEALFTVGNTTWTGDLICITDAGVRISDHSRSLEYSLFTCTGNIYIGCTISNPTPEIGVTAWIRNIVTTGAFPRFNGASRVIIERLETRQASPLNYCTALVNSDGSVGSVQQVDILNFVYPTNAPSAGIQYSNYISKLGAILIHAHNGDATKYFGSTSELDFGDQVTMGQAADWGYGGAGKALVFSPTSTTSAGYRVIYAPVVDGEEYKLTFQVRKTSSGGNSTLSVSIFGAGVTAVRDESVSLTDSWAKFESTAFTADWSGYVTIVLKFTDGSTSCDIGLDDIKVEKQ